MKKDISPETIANIKSNIRIEDYIKQYIDLKQVGTTLVGLCPFHDEKTPSFKIDTTKNRYHCFGCDATGDLIDFIQMFHKASYQTAVDMAADFGNISVVRQQVSDTIKVFKEYKPIKHAKPFVHPILDMGVYNRYDKRPIKLWEEEGINSKTIDAYNIRYDTLRDRIVYPVYDLNGNLINVKGRTIYEEYKKLDIPKYINYYKVGCMDYLRELNKAQKYVKEKGEMIIFEGIKSCMKAFQLGMRNQVAAETSALTYEQIKLILGFHCDVVIAFDKDKKLEDYYNDNMKLLSRFTNLYYINDTKNLLGDPSEKKSPIDNGLQVWEELYSSRERVID